MISVEKVGGANNRHHAEFVGNASDIVQLEKEFIPNGSLYTVIEQDKTYMYDKEHDKWYLHSTGGGGGYDGLPIYLWTSGSSYAVNNLVIKDNLMYICTVANSDTEWDENHWSAIGSADGNYGIVDTYDSLPSGLTVSDRKIYFVIDEGIYYLWDGTDWVAQTTKVETISTQEIDDLFD